MVLQHMDNLEIKKSCDLFTKKFWLGEGCEGD